MAVPARVSPLASARLPRAAGAGDRWPRRVAGTRAFGLLACPSLVMASCRGPSALAAAVLLPRAPAIERPLSPASGPVGSSREPARRFAQAPKGRAAAGGPSACPARGGCCWAARGRAPCWRLQQHGLCRGSPGGCAAAASHPVLTCVAPAWHQPAGVRGGTRSQRELGPECGWLQGWSLARLASWPWLPAGAGGRWGWDAVYASSHHGLPGWPRKLPEKENPAKGRVKSWVCHCQ